MPQQQKLRTAFFLLLTSFSSYSQNLTQNIKGQIFEDGTQFTVAYAHVFVDDSTLNISTYADDDGNFVLSNVPVGRYTIKAESPGYETITIPEVLVTNAKEVVLKVNMSTQVIMLDEIVIEQEVQKQNAENNMAIVSARMLSVEEANRYAGGFNDPARLAASFAGVSSNVNNNAIVIRGNAPKYLQWKMEGIEIPNPNHFADLSAFGGGGLTALSSNLLANSDFFTGAFPSEYTNAISGVFDIKMRKGNNSEHEHTFEVGTIGVDLASEGPLNKNKKSSYLLNYRYATLGLVAPFLPKEARGTNYQDLAFKFYIPVKKSHTLAIWGIGLKDYSGSNAEMDSLKWKYLTNKQESGVDQYMGTAGLNHVWFTGSKSYLENTLAFTTNGLAINTEILDKSLRLQPYEKIENRFDNLILKSVLNKKISDKHFNKTGLTITRLGYDFSLEKTMDSSNTLIPFASRNDASTLLAFFTSSLLSYNKTKINLGLSSQFFTLSSKYTIEPRIGISRELNSKSELSFGYGLHSRLEKINIYFIQNQSDNALNNKNLNFVKANHFVLGYNRKVKKNTHLKIEPYFQYLFDVPIVKNTNISLLNQLNDWFFNETLVNEGYGKNYGIDFTLEQYMNKGFYYMVTTSVFESKFKNSSDGEWYNTRFNRNFLINALAGKEFTLGVEKTKKIGVNLRVSMQGGDRYSPIDYGLSNAQQSVVFDETKPFTTQIKPSFVTHFTADYKWEKKKTSQSLSLKIINLTNYKEFLSYQYNYKTNKVEAYREALFIPNLSYRISF